MVFDRLDDAARYFSLGGGIETVLRWFQTYRDTGADLPERTELEPGRIWIRGVNYKTAPSDNLALEAHRAFVDVMYVVEGTERFYYKPFAEAETIAMPYSAEKECALAALDADACSCRFSAGHFVIFFPQDGHYASQLWQQPEKVRKFIAKVALDTL